MIDEYQAGDERPADAALFPLTVAAESPQTAMPVKIKKKRRSLISRYGRETGLSGAFVCVIVLIIVVGATALRQIEYLSRTIQLLGNQYVARERETLEIKSRITYYVAGVRNYLIWHLARHLPAAFGASELDLVKESMEKIEEALLAYRRFIVPERFENMRVLEQGARTLKLQGEQLVAFTQEPERDGDRILQLLRLFEDRYYSLDSYITNTISGYNHSAIEELLGRAQAEKRVAVLMLIVSAGASVLLALIIAGITLRNLRKERRRREALVQRLIRVEEEERKHVAAQIHDQLGQDLSALKIYLGLVESKLSPEQTDAREKISQSRRILSDLIEKGHNISELLRPPQLDEVGLHASLSALVEEFRQLNGEAMCATYQAAAAVHDQFRPEISLIIYRFVQEALTNCARHARARSVQVFVRRQEDMLLVSVRDDGCGFDPVIIEEKPRRRRDDRVRIGLQGLRERIELLGGQLRIVSTPMRGTELTACLPLYDSGERG